MKVYAVKRGNKTGIFENWSECEAATKGFLGAELAWYNTPELFLEEDA